MLVMNFLINFLKNCWHNMFQLLSFSKNTLKNSLNIYVKFNRDTLSVGLNPNWDIKDVKEFVAPQLGLQPNEMKIIFAGKELSDTTKLEECDLGQQSVLHAVKARANTKILLDVNTSSIIEEAIEEHDPSKPLSQTMKDLQLEKSEHENPTKNDPEHEKARFFVFCSQCKELCSGKLRVRCSQCRSGAFTVYKDPECWNDVLKPDRIIGFCEMNKTQVHSDLPWYAEFYFKCANHVSMGENDFAVPLSLIKRNIKNISCISCTDISEVVLVFPCIAGHVTCLDCFRQYCLSRLMDRQFILHEKYGYTLACPVGCENSFIKQTHHFKLLSKDQYDRYQRFATEEFILNAGGVLCPKPDCGMGLLVDANCKKVTCEKGCGYVFCRNCHQGFHLGDCSLDDTPSSATSRLQFAIDPQRATQSRWDEASRVTIKVITKPCPKCRTPTERDGGCMHLICIRCQLEWCWVCQTEWTRDCMGAHWFG